MGERIRIHDDGSALDGYLATPRESPSPGIVVIHEWWGLVPHIEEVCDRFASDGFMAFAPDLCGRTTTEPDEAEKIMMELDFPRAIEQISQAIAHLRAHPAANGKVAVAGFCMGGALTLAAAAKSGPDAAVPFYGVPSKDPGYDEIRCPVLGHWAEHDDWASQDIGRSLFERLASNGIEATLYVYPGTEHAFFNDHRPEVYDESAALTAYARTLEFLRRHLL